MYNYDVSPIYSLNENVTDESCRENQNTYFMSSNFSESRTVCEKMWKNVVELERPHMAI